MYEQARLAYSTSTKLMRWPKEEYTKKVSEYDQENSKTCVKRPLSKWPKIGFQDQLSFNAGHMYCRMLLVEHSAILSTFVKLPIVIKIFALSIFEWPFYTGFTVPQSYTADQPNSVCDGKVQ